MEKPDICKGCVCAQCAKSEKSGNLYGCPYKYCRSCQEGDYTRRSFCDVCVALDAVDPADLRL
jgi:hypothetical protein